MASETYSSLVLSHWDAYERFAHKTTEPSALNGTNLSLGHAVAVARYVCNPTGAWNAAHALI